MPDDDDEPLGWMYPSELPFHEEGRMEWYTASIPPPTPEEIEEAAQWRYDPRTGGLLRVILGGKK